MDTHRQKVKKRSDDQVLQGFNFHNWRSWLPLSLFLIFFIAALVYSHFLDEPYFPKNYSQESSFAAGGMTLLKRSRDETWNSAGKPLNSSNKRTSPANGRPSKLAHNIPATSTELVKNIDMHTQNVTLESPPSTTLSNKLPHKKQFQSADRKQLRLSSPTPVASDESADKKHLPPSPPPQPQVGLEKLANIKQSPPTPTPTPTPSTKPTPACPEYFRWIHEDLSPWRDSGITVEMVKKVKGKANFRLVIVNGTAYGEIYSKSRYNRDTFTLWGIVQLLRMYPDKIPDLDLMFHLRDRPIIRKDLYPGPGEIAPPPLFGYDGDDATFDIVFPDWSFWGWPNHKLKPWKEMSKELKEANVESRWVDRDPHAYWKGSLLSADRMDLANCNVSNQHDWNARIYNAEWNEEKKQGYKHSNFANQCKHRYKIYIEGVGWSVSEKYILACDSVTLRVKPRFYTFFSRNLMPLQHYWPIKRNDKCRSIKYAVEWGNIRREEAQSIGKAASNFIQEEMKMDYVYDYMFHLLNGYAKLLKYKPSVPPKAIKLCWESIASNDEKGLKNKYMRESSIRDPSLSKPCALPPPYDPHTRRSILQRKRNLTNVVDIWERRYWDFQQNKRN